MQTWKYNNILLILIVLALPNKIYAIEEYNVYPLSQHTNIDKEMYINIASFAKHDRNIFIQMEQNCVIDSKPYYDEECAEWFDLSINGKKALILLNFI